MTPAHAGMRKKGEGASTDHGVLWACGHQTRGGQCRKVGSSRTPWRCINCVEAAKAAKAAAP